MIDWLRRPAAPRVVKPRTLRIGGQDLPLVIRRLRQAKRMTLRLSPDGSEVRVSIPAWGRVGDAEAFARDRADWLAQQLARLPAQQALEPGAPVPFRGVARRLDWHANGPRKPSIGEDAIILGGPREGLESRLRRWLEREALALLADDLAHYCARGGHPVPRLALSRAQRRWGSCAADGSIRINWRLVMAPISSGGRSWRTRSRICATSTTARPSTPNSIACSKGASPRRTIG
jgi:predicted metal-dependent hydrolase